MKKYPLSTQHRTFNIRYSIFYILNSSFCIRYSIFFILHSSFLSCSSPPPPTPAFYHWQTNLHLSSEEVNFLKTLKIQKLYVKFFDVDWDASLNEPVPLAEANLRQDGLGQLEIIPTIFITNRTIRELPQEDILLLAKRICDKLFEISEQLPDKKIREIQIDCDWSGQTRANYFQLLETIESLIQPKNILLSATIRLHQIKFKDQTGIPPVQRGMLMFYNVGQVEDWTEDNSILNMQTAAAYTDYIDRYPLPLDLVLPVFAWGVVFRQGKMIRLINNLRPEDLADPDRFVKTADNRFEVVKSTYINGYYLYRGDLIRTESIPTTLLQQAVRVLKPELPSAARTLAFYHLDTATIKHYAHEDLEALFLEMAQK